jgi:hypothetical protein
MLASCRGRFCDSEAELNATTGLTSLSEPVLQDDPVNDLPAKNASPAEKVLRLTVEFFVSHRTATTVTFHSGHLPLSYTNLFIGSLNFKAGGWKIIDRLTDG